MKFCKINCQDTYFFNTELYENEGVQIHSNTIVPKRAPPHLDLAKSPQMSSYFMKLVQFKELIVDIKYVVGEKC